jgi:hypothetical protein
LGEWPGTRNPAAKLASDTKRGDNQKLKRTHGMRNALAYICLVSAFWSGALAGVSIADDDTRSIVKLAFRDHNVTISSSPEGLRYTVRDRSGKLLSENLSEKELLAEHPKLHSQIRSGYADDATGSFIWAGRDESLIEPPPDSSIENK